MRIMPIAALVLAFSLPSFAAVKTAEWGKLADGTPVHCYTLTNANGLVLKATDFGCNLLELRVPDRNGKIENIVLGADDLKTYEDGCPFASAVIGRFANRIRGAKFTLNGVEYKVTANRGPDHIHGGVRNFAKLVWKGECLETPDGPAVRFTHTSPDGTEGFPGTMAVTVTYTLTNKNEMKLEYAATTDKPTVVNLTNHGYYNLHGAANGDVLSHELTINAEKYLVVDDATIPTGEIRPVEGTPLDFRKTTTVGARIAQVGRGYDHCYVLKQTGSPALAATVRDPASGRVMEVWTTEPGVQLFTANQLAGKVKGHDGIAYNKHAGLCLETQHFPDAPNHANFPSTVLNPGATYRQVTIHRFYAK